MSKHHLIFDLDKLNPTQPKGLSFGICQFCNCQMNPDRWNIYEAGYECKKCGHKIFHRGLTTTKCKCKNCTIKEEEYVGQT